MNSVKRLTKTREHSIFSGLIKVFVKHFYNSNHVTPCNRSDFLKIALYG